MSAIHRRLALVATAAAVAVTAACSSGGDATSVDADGRRLTKVTVAVPTLDYGFLPVVLAKDKGYYAKEGLDVDIPVMRPNAAVPALAANQIDFAVAGSSVRAAHQGTPLKAVFYSYHEATLMAVGAPSIRSFDDLRGKTIAINSPGGSEDIITRLLLARENIPLSAVKIVPLGAATSEGLRSGRVQFALVNPDHAVRLEKERFRILGHTRELMPIPWSGFAVNADTIAARADMLHAWLRATIRALRYIKQHPDETADFAASRFNLDAESARRALDLLLPAISADDPGGFTVDGLVTLTDVDLKTLKLTGDARERGVRVHDLGPLRRAQRDLGITCTSGYGCQ